jgi:GNAT superfamily N-acetyltransferase
VPAGFVIESLSADHELDEFDCGTPALNHWLKTWAHHSQRTGSTRTFVMCPEGSKRVVGYHALTAASASREEAPKALARAAWPHQVPLVLLARLGVDQAFKGRQLGAALMRDAFVRTVQAASQVGAVAMMVHAKDDEARRFYEHWGFTPSPLEQLQLFLPLKTIRQSMVEAEADQEQAQDAGRSVSSAP